MTNCRYDAHRRVANLAMQRGQLLRYMTDKSSKRGSHLESCIAIYSVSLWDRRSSGRLDTGLQDDLVVRAPAAASRCEDTFLH
jgi:hypothetical protein